MKTAIKLLLLSIISATLFWHCERCVIEELPTRKFTDEELKIVPYLKGDTITFLSRETNKTYAFHVVDKITDYEKFSRGNPHDKYSSYCTGDYYYSQYLNTSFDVQNCGLDLNISNSFEANDIGKNLTIYFSIPNDTLILKFHGIYNIGEDTIMTGTNKVSAYHNSLTLNGTRFTNVYELLGMVYTPQHEYLKTAFYTFNQGLVGFLTNNGNMWSLKK
ncbi:MAG: hypothetical protein WCK34_12075 [Bacteroidota bacterium]